MVKKNVKTDSGKSLADAHCRTTGGPVWLSQTDGGVLIDVHAQPGAKRDAIVGEYNARLKISLSAPPVDGKANAYLSKFLAKRLGVAKSEVVLITGDTCRTKRFFVKNVDLAHVTNTLTSDK